MFDGSQTGGVKEGKGYYQFLMVDSRWAYQTLQIAAMEYGRLRRKRQLEAI
jgi:hypothetical protein